MAAHVYKRSFYFLTPPNCISMDTTIRKFFAGCEQARNHSASTLQTTPWQESGLVDGWVEDVDSRGRGKGGTRTISSNHRLRESASSRD